MLEQFITQLLQDKGLPPSLGPEVRSQLVSDLTTRVTDLINKRLIEGMSEEQVRNFNRILDQEPIDSTAIQQFITENIKNKEEITSGALLEFRELYLGLK